MRDDSTREKEVRKMEYKRQSPAAVKVKPRLIIHGGAGNIKPSNLQPPEYAEYRHALLTIVSSNITNSHPLPSQRSHRSPPQNYHH